MLSPSVLNGTNNKSTLNNSALRAISKDKDRKMFSAIKKNHYDKSSDKSSNFLNQSSYIEIQSRAPGPDDMETMSMMSRGTIKSRVSASVKVGRVKLDPKPKE